jgi:hypothetical protein
MLNTDLHNPSQKNKMSKEAFVQRTRSAAADAKLVRGLLTRPGLFSLDWDRPMPRPCSCLGRSELSNRGRTRRTPT